MNSAPNGTPIPNATQRPRIFLSPPHMGGNEWSYVQNVFETNWIAPVGPHLAKFEAEFAKYVGVGHAVALSSGTSALHLALRHLALQPGDEVICSTFTFCASANPIFYEHARPVLIDADPKTWNLDPHLLQVELDDAARRNRLPKAIIAVDLLGQSADMDPIRECADTYQIPVIEDAAEALGATYKGRGAGTSGWAAAFSFNGNKIITTSGGGMLVSDDYQVVEHVRHLSTQAREPGTLYRHNEIGFNYRMSNVCAAIGLGQLEVLPDRIRKRTWIHDYYVQNLADVPGICFMPQASYGVSNHWLTSIEIDPKQFGRTCEEVRLALEQENIESRRVWVPLHLQKPFAGCRTRGGAVAEGIFERGLSLPSGTALEESDLDRVIKIIRSK